MVKLTHVVQDRLAAIEVLDLVESVAIQRLPLINDGDVREENGLAAVEILYFVEPLVHPLGHVLDVDVRRA